MFSQRARLPVWTLALASLSGWAVVVLLLVPTGVMMGWYLAAQVTQGSMIGMTLTMPILLVAEFFEQALGIMLLQGAWIGLVLLSALLGTDPSARPMVGALQGLLLSAPGAIWFALLGTREGGLGPLLGLAMLVAGAVGGLVIAAVVVGRRAVQK